MLIIVCGLQGTGKTYIARRIAGKFEAELLRTDVIRKEILKETTYKGQEIQNIYGEMFSRAERFLKENKNIVLDATFAREDNRLTAKEMAASMPTGFIIVEVVCHENVVEQRLNERFGDESDAEFDVYLKCKPLFENIAEPHIIIDNSGTTEETDNQIETAFLAFQSESF
jgi:predicted kinase